MFRSLLSDVAGQPDDPPQDHGDQNADRETGTEQGVIETRESVPPRLCEVQHRNDWNHDHQQGVVPPRARDVEADQGVDGPLCPASRTSQPRERVKRTLRKQIRPFRIISAVKEKQEQQTDGTCAPQYGSPAAAQVAHLCGLIDFDLAGCRDEQEHEINQPECQPRIKADIDIGFRLSPGGLCLLVPSRGKQRTDLPGLDDAGDAERQTAEQRNQNRFG